MPQFGASRTDDSRAVIYDRNVFILQAPDYDAIRLLQKSMDRD